MARSGGEAYGTLGEIASADRAAYVLALRLIGSPEDAEDAVQQAYLKALDSLRGGPPPREARTWFLTVVANAARDHLRMSRRRARREAEVRAGNAMVGAGACGEPGAAPLDAAQSREIVGRLRTALEGLEPERRALISLCYEQGCSRREAARILGVPARTASDRLAQGLEELRRALQAAGCAAAPAAVIEALTQTAPTVPASLATFVKSMMAGAGQGAVAASATATAAATGGLGILWKLAAGISLAAILGAGSWGAWRHWHPAAAAPEAPQSAAAEPERLPDDREALDREICDLIVGYRRGDAPRLKNLLLRGWQCCGDRSYLTSYASMAEPTDADTIAQLITEDAIPSVPPAQAKDGAPAEDAKAREARLSGERRRRDLWRADLFMLLAGLDRERARGLARGLWDKLEERDALVRTLAKIGSREDLEWLLGQLKDGHLPKVRDTGFALDYGQELPEGFHVAALVEMAKGLPSKARASYSGSIERLTRPPTGVAPGWIHLLELKAAGTDVAGAEEAFAKTRARLPELTADNLRDWASVGLDAEARDRFMELYPRIKTTRNRRDPDIVAILAYLWADGAGREWVDKLADGDERDRALLIQACVLLRPMAERHVKLLEAAATRPQDEKGRVDAIRSRAQDALAGLGAERVVALCRQETPSSWAIGRWLRACKTEEDFAKVFEALTDAEAVRKGSASLLLQVCTNGWLKDRSASAMAAGRRVFTDHPERLKVLLDRCFPPEASRWMSASNFPALDALPEMGLDLAGMLRSKNEEDVIRVLACLNRKCEAHFMYPAYIPLIGADDQAEAFERLSEKGKRRFLEFNPRYYAPPFCAALVKLAAADGQGVSAEAARSRLAGFSQQEPAYLLPLYRSWLKSDSPDLFALGALCLGVRERQGWGLFPELPKALAARLPELKGHALVRAICAQAHLSPKDGVSRAIAAWPGLDVPARAGLIAGLESVKSWSGRDLPDAAKIGALIVDGLLETDDLGYRRAAIASHSGKLLWSYLLLRDEWGDGKGAPLTPEQTRLRARAAAAMIAVLRDDRDPESQRAVAYWIVYAGGLMASEPKIKATIEEVSRTSRDEAVRQYMAEALKRLEGKQHALRPQSEPIPAPPEVF